MQVYKKITSLDGTTISYAMDGQGLGIIIIPGNNRMTHDYRKISTLLVAKGFKVFVIERRGRGESGPQGGCVLSRA